MEPQLLEILACPCPAHAQLRPGTDDDPQADYLTCVECQRSFPVRDGIPVLLLEEAVGGPAQGTSGEE
nr:Trm112 family protein [Saccharopolyspora sp. HNM0983]